MFYLIEKCKKRPTILPSWNIIYKIELIWNHYLKIFSPAIISLLTVHKKLILN